MVAEQLLREDIEKRAALQKKLLRKQKEQTEQELRQLAQMAASAVTETDRDREAQEREEEEREIEGYAEVAARSTKREAEEEDDEREGSSRRHHSDDEDEEGHGDKEGKAERDRIRRERARELQRELRMESRKIEKGVSKGLRDRERDVSEKIALGQGGGGGLSKDNMFDSRLFNQDGGIGSGFGADDSYGVYDKALFGSSSSSQTYRPRAVDLDEPGAPDGSTASFKPTKGFAGTEQSTSNGPRSRPVEFERDDTDDPFGLGSLLNTNEKDIRKPSALDHIGNKGHLGLGSIGGTEANRDLQIKPNSNVHPDRQIHFAAATSSTNVSLPSSSSSSSRDKDRDRYRRRSRSRSRSRSRDRRSPDSHKRSRHH